MKKENKRTIAMVLNLDKRQDKVISLMWDDICATAPTANTSHTLRLLLREKHERGVSSGAYPPRDNANVQFAAPTLPRLKRKPGRPPKAGT